jgi:hydrogen peroxide-dependent heme synthase
MSIIAPATLEGWYVLHQMVALDWPEIREADPARRRHLADAARHLFQEIAPAADHGWSAPFRLVAGGGADLMFVHFRSTLDELAEVQTRVRASELGSHLTPVLDYLSVTEAGLYHATAEAARSHGPGTPGFVEAIRTECQAELASAHVRTRLYPQVPETMRYMSFYPMTKRRGETHNWYTLDVAERSRLMRDHGMTGRKYAGRVFQVISGSVGLDDWEWGVTLFAADPLEFKRIVTEMRYDEASSRYGEFGAFYTGIRMTPDGWESALGI